MENRGNKKRLEGIVISDKRDKTVTVRVERLIKHKVYKKYIRRRTKFTAHDEENKCGVGDRVLITESRPLSRLKRWRVMDIVEKAV
ncbi:MAG: 30S ribosomal protein S17 [Thermodesulfobacteriota bacterium]|nr:30S ribosomal protein S17 [Thermodesulfobacteriota bacterium]